VVTVAPSARIRSTFIGDAFFAAKIVTSILRRRAE
jgi:hypothetical protein